MMLWTSSGPEVQVELGPVAMKSRAQFLKRRGVAGLQRLAAAISGGRGGATLPRIERLVRDRECDRAVLSTQASR